jgi:hypothetical protein
MGGFVMWLASTLDEARRIFQKKRLAIRQQVQAEHKRTADVIAQLGAAWEVYLVFARDVGAVEAHAVDELWERVWSGLVEIAAEQSEMQQAAEPTARFRDLIAAALSTGRAYIASAVHGGAPHADQERWGWEAQQWTDPQGLERTSWKAGRGECIGWLTADGALFLEPDVAYLAASKIGVIGVSAETLSARLADKGITVTERDGKGRRYRVRRPVMGQRRRVLHIRSVDWLYPPESGSTGPSGPGGEKIQRSHWVEGGPLH